MIKSEEWSELIMMIENKVKKILKMGGTVIGCQIAEVRSPNKVGF